MRSARPLASLAAAAPLALALAASCAEPRTRVSPAASRSLGSPGDACRTASPEVPAFPDGGLVDLDDLQVRPRPVEPVFEGRPLLSPERPGESASELSGCLAGEGTAAAGARYPVPEERPRDEVRVNPLSRGLLITHDLVHRCCLRAEVSTEAQGGAVRVTEGLSGTPCGDCRCASRVYTAVALAPGRYSVEVVVRGPGAEERTAYSGSATLPAPAREDHVRR